MSIHDILSAYVYFAIDYKHFISTISQEFFQFFFCHFSIKGQVLKNRAWIEISNLFGQPKLTIDHFIQPGTREGEGNAQRRRVPDDVANRRIEDAEQ